jgi:hypothetical protein
MCNIMINLKQRCMIDVSWEAKNQKKNEKPTQ